MAGSKINEDLYDRIRGGQRQQALSNVLMTGLGFGGALLRDKLQADRAADLYRERSHAEGEAAGQRLQMEYALKQQLADNDPTIPLRMKELEARIGATRALELQRLGRSYGRARAPGAGVVAPDPVTPEQAEAASKYLGMEPGVFSILSRDQQAKAVIEAMKAGRSGSKAGSVVPADPQQIDAMAKFVGIDSGIFSGMSRNDQSQAVLETLRSGKEPNALEAAAIEMALRTWFKQQEDPLAAEFAEREGRGFALPSQSVMQQIREWASRMSGGDPLQTEMLLWGLREPNAPQEAAPQPVRSLREFLTSGPVPDEEADEADAILNKYRTYRPSRRLETRYPARK